MQFLYTLPSGLFEKSMKLGAKNLRHCMYSTYSMYSAFMHLQYICTLYNVQYIRTNKCRHSSAGRTSNKKISSKEECKTEASVE